MKVSHFGGEVDCQTMKELDALLNIRYGTGANEYWIPREGYPCLAIMVNHDFAFLAFYPEDGHPGFQSVGEDTTLDQKETSIFYTNTPTEEIEVWNEFVVPFSKAHEAAMEFFTALSLPVCVEWSEQ